MAKKRDWRLWESTYMQISNFGHCSLFHDTGLTYMWGYTVLLLDLSWM